ncbi:MAG: GNAT family N-acetyltransferase [Gemmataceae bacterium]
MKQLDIPQTPRLILTRMTAADLDDLTRMHLDSRVMATLGGIRAPEQTRDWLDRQIGHWERCGFGLWMARERQSGCFAGRGGLHYIEIDGREEIEVGYSFMPEFWGRGLATELARESIRVGFHELNFPELVCFTLRTNLASQRVMWKAGFRYERDLLWKDLPHVLYRLRRADAVDLFV